MNFLAHAYLSFNHTDILVGNMISDFVKGKQRFEYSEQVQQGIILHRQIDAFTDVHEATKEARAFLKPAVGLYSGAFIDVVYDHFLANDPLEFREVPLSRYVEETYIVLANHHHVLPLAFRQILPYMQSQNWLYNYKNMSGIQKSFGGVVRRAKYLDDSSKVFGLFEKHYDKLRNCYKTFFPFVKAFSQHQIEQLKN